MDSDLSKQLIQIIIGDKHYALIPLCTFNDIPPKQDDVYQFEVLEKQFGLKNTHRLFDLYEIIDPKKVALVKLKYGI